MNSNPWPASGGCWTMVEDKSDKSQATVSGSSIPLWYNSMWFPGGATSKANEPTGMTPEAQKPKTFRMAAVYAQIFSGRSARRHFSKYVKKARNHLSWQINKCVILSRDITIWMILKLTYTVCNCPDSYQTIRTVFKPSWQFSNWRSDSFQTVQTVLKPFGQ